MKIAKTTKDNSSQHGVTLLLSILILAAITAVVFSLAAIITIEIRSSGDVLRTEPAVYAVQGVTEEAFFKYDRFVSDSALDVTGCAPTALNVCTLNGVTMTQTPPVVRQFDDAPRADVIPASSPPTVARYLFFDPTQPGNFGQTYNSITLKELNSVTGVTATLSQCCDSTGNSAVLRTDNLTPGTADSIPLGSGQYELAIQNPSSTQAVLVQIDAVKTTAVNGSTHLIPLFSKTLDITASYLGLTRKYSVTVPQGSAPAAGASANSASFVGGDTSTQGSWKGVYGADGFQIFEDSSSLPGYASVTPNNQKTDYTWTGSTSLPQALVKGFIADRIAACWYNPSGYSIDVNMTGGTHKVSLYLLDWDNAGRVEKVEIIDADTGTVLNSQTVSSFGSGKYLSWNIKGHVTISITTVSGANSVVSGIFFN